MIVSRQANFSLAQQLHSRGMLRRLIVASAICIGASAGTATAGPQWLEAEARSTVETATIVPSTAINATPVADTPADTVAPTFESTPATPGSVDPLSEPLPAAVSAGVPTAGIAGFPDEQPPMIPLPPAVWTGLAGVAGIAIRIVRPRRGRRA